MSEKRQNPLRKLDTQHPGSDSVPLEDLHSDVFEMDAPPTDDSPTVISKNHPKPQSAEDLPAINNLRGRILAHFELIEPIGVGGMAAVLRARDTQLDRFVALKILPPDMAKDPENVKRFHQEARSAAKLDHENIARVFFCGEDQRLNFIAFEFVEGDNLRTILERRGQLPVSEALHYVLQVAAGLAHACRRGVVHRDIKPSNIIITPNGRAKLVDMGLARSLEPQKDMQLTQSGVTLGTFDYISPEQALEPREADVRSDIYSLGCTFYHMLTGHAPVPEGTAAKKLNHHQNIKPIDPRQYVPEIPDDVAMILDRMMAKKAKDRYQTPEHLVHELLTAARKIGASFDVPEGVLSVEGAVPSPRHRRPLLLAALAVASVVGLILLLDHAEPAGPPVDSGQPRDNEIVDTGKKNPEAKTDPLKTNPPAKDGLKIGPGPNQNPDPPVDTQTARYNADNPTPQGLADWLEKNSDKQRLEIELARDIELKIREEGVDPGLKFKAVKEVILRGRDPQQRPTIRLTYNGPPFKAPWSAVTIDSESSRIENIRFVIDAAGGIVDLNGLLVRNGRNHRVSRCEFIQAQPEEGRRVASVVIEAVPGLTSMPTLDLQECCFLGYRELTVRPGSAQEGLEVVRLEKLEGGGQDAVVRRGAAHVDAYQCAFSPHASIFRVERTTATAPSLNIRHCTLALGTRSAAVHLSDNASAKIDVRHSLVAGIADSSLGDMPRTGGAVLIRQTDVRELGVSWAGLDNRYFNLDAFWRDADMRAEDWKDFARQFEHPSSLEVKESPWQATRPLGALESLQLTMQTDPNKPARPEAGERREEEQRLREGFQIKARVRELRQADTPENVTRRLVGVEQFLGISYLVNLPSLDEASPGPIVRKDRVVDPDAPADPSNGRYQSLEQAMSFASPGEVIVIRKNGFVVLQQPIRLEKGEIDVTLRADKGFKPVLTLAEPRDKNASLFTLYDGKLRLEDLEFRLRPANAEYQSLNVVSLVGGGQCILKDCLVTLDRAGTECAMSVASFREPGKAMMRMEAKATQLDMDNCVVRGDGDLIAARGSRAFDFKVRNTLAVLHGSLVSIEAEGDGLPPTGALKAVATLSHVTTYLTGPLIRLQATKDLKGLVPLSCKPSDCVFVAAAGKALVHFDGGDTGPRGLKEKLIWEPGMNAYSSFINMISFQPPRGDEMAPAPMNQQQWKEFSGENGSRFMSVKFAAPAANGSFLTILPGQFKVLDPMEFGADVAPLRVPLAADKDK